MIAAALGALGLLFVGAEIRSSQLDPTWRSALVFLIRDGNDLSELSLAPIELTIKSGHSNDIIVVSVFECSDQHKFVPPGLYLGNVSLTQRPLSPDQEHFSFSGLQNFLLWQDDPTWEDPRRDPISAPFLSNITGLRNDVGLRGTGIINNKLSPWFFVRLNSIRLSEPHDQSGTVSSDKFFVAEFDAVAGEVYRLTRQPCLNAATYSQDYREESNDDGSDSRPGFGGHPRGNWFDIAIALFGFLGIAALYGGILLYIARDRRR